MHDNIRKTGIVVAKIISAFLHPLLVPLYGLLIIFSAPTMIGYLPAVVKKTLLFLILINNVLLPFSFIPYFRMRNLISSWNIDNRKERTAPLVTTSFFFSVTFFITYRYHIPVFIKAYILALAILAIAVTIINFRYRISIHAAGSGMLTALVAILSIKMHAPLPGLLVAVLMSSGLVMTSRLWLGSHDPEEVWSGFFLGLVITGIFLFIF